MAISRRLPGVRQSTQNHSQGMSTRWAQQYQESMIFIQLPIRFDMKGFYNRRLHMNRNSCGCHKKCLITSDPYFGVPQAINLQWPTQHIYIPNHSATGRMWDKVNFWTEWTWLEFSFPFPGLVYPTNFLIDWGRMDGFMPFPRALTINKIQTAFSRIWTLVTNSISYNDNDYMRHTFI